MYRICQIDEQQGSETIVSILDEHLLQIYLLMQLSASPNHSHVEEDYFESTQKETAIETINFIPMKTFSNEITRTHRKKEEDIIWKLKGVESPSPNTKKIQYKFSKNISFEDEEKISSSEDEDSQQEQPQLSSFVHHYKQCEEIYHKRYNFGTSWIGRKQYLASTFVNPSNIERLNLQYFFETEAEPCSSQFGFDSNFESGNLFSVFKIGNNEYDLLLQNDLNTKGNTQWFYFRIANPPKNTNIKVNIVNMRKSDSLFNYGMMPCIFSMQEDKKSSKGWFRGGKHIRYFKNNHLVENSKRYYYTLSFIVSTPYQNDVLRIAQSYPYSYSDLNNYLDNCQKIKYKKELMERETLMNTVGRNKIQVVTIKQTNSKIKVRPLIVIIARQHPGQTPASFICEGLIDFLLSKQKESQFIRKCYEIKVIPMINPDGVCAGNYRTNLSGFDLNRRWDGSKVKNLHEAAFIKKYLNQLIKGRQVSFILDLHGHSRKMFSFFYGNPSPTNPIDVRIFPLLCSKLSPNYIKFQDCTFTSQQYKRNTARVQFGLSFKALNIFTFEASFFGYYGKDKQRKHFTTADYRQLGAILGRAIYIHQKGKELFESTPDNKEIILYKKCLYQLRDNMILISLGEKPNSGSQSSPQQCQLKQNEGQRLEENEDYSKDNSPQKNIKIIKRIVKKQQLKLPAKSERQMQVMDIAQVNSIFPSNILALIPSSFLTKKKKPETCCRAVQTDSTPIIKIYQTCKKQQNRFFYNPQSSIIHPRSDIGSPIKKPSNLLKSNILHRARSESEDRELFSSAGLSRMSQRKGKQSTQTAQNTHKKTHSTHSSLNRGVAHREVQTILSFNCLSFGQMRSKLQKQISILELKTIDPTFTTFNYSKQKESTIIGKTSSINMLESIKIRKRNNV